MATSGRLSGRIDRIGSPHSEVFIRCVFPDSRLDDLLRLEERLHHKIKQAAASVGSPQVLPHQRGRDRSYSETRTEIERLQRAEAGLFEAGRTTAGAPSGEEFRAELRQAVDSGHEGETAGLPWGSGSGMAARDSSLATGKRGYVFCIRVADDPKPLFRYVELDIAQHPGADPPTGEAPASRTRILEKTLECLDAARPPGGTDTPRLLDEATRDRAYDAWEIARADVIKAWAPMTDKANLEPRLEKALHDAAAILRSSPPQGCAQEQIDDAISSLSAPLDRRLVNEIRAAIRGGQSEAEQAANILEVVRERGLQPYVPPEPWPSITEDDIQLVCWQALTPGADLDEAAEQSCQERPLTGRDQPARRGEGSTIPSRVA